MDVQHRPGCDPATQGRVTLHWQPCDCDGAPSGGHHQQRCWDCGAVLAVPGCVRAAPMPADRMPSYGG